jgi:hypothetical protein
VEWLYGLKPYPSKPLRANPKKHTNREDLVRGWMRETLENGHAIPEVMFELPLNDQNYTVLGSRWPNSGLSLWIFPNL